MTNQEIKVLDLTKDAYNQFIALPVLHQDDAKDFTYHIHALQNIILAREGVRKMDGNHVKDKENKKHKPHFIYLKDGGFKEVTSAEVERRCDEGDLFMWSELHPNDNPNWIYADGKWNYVGENNERSSDICTSCGSSNCIC